MEHGVTGSEIGKMVVAGKGWGEVLSGGVVWYN